MLGNTDMSKRDKTIRGISHLNLLVIMTQLLYASGFSTNKGHQKLPSNSDSIALYSSSTPDSP